MRTSDVVSSLQRRGVTLKIVAGSLKISGVDKLTDREKAALKANKSSLLRALSHPTATTAGVAVAANSASLPTRTEPPEPGSTAPFNQEALDAVKAGAGCWVWSGVLNEWLFWVRDEERKAKAIRHGIDPGCIWTLEELTGVQGMPPKSLRDVAAIKRKFAGTMQPGEVPARWRDALQPLEPAVAHRQDAGTVPYRLNIGGHTQLVWLSPGLETADVIQCAKVANPGVEVSNKPPPQDWPRLADIPQIGTQQETPPLVAKCRTCLRYGPNDHYCGHKLRHIREGEGPICSGKGYSPKGEPWKEDRS